MILTDVIRKRSLVFALASAAILAPQIAWTQTSQYKTVEPNVLTVAITGDMPGLIAKDGKLIGYDGEILQIAAENLGLKINPRPTEWSGAIAAVQAGRVDVIGGTVAWTPERARALSLTDPTGYFQNGITQKSSTHWNTLKDLENRKVGSMTGFSFLPELRKIPGIELTLYDTSDAALRDLINGRVEAIIGDPPVIDYAITQNPDWGLANIAFSDNNPDFPLLTSIGRQYIFGLSKENKPLADAISGEIRKLWENCAVKDIGRNYGFSREAQFTPSKVNFREGVDRPQGWEAPACRK